MLSVKFKLLSPDDVGPDYVAWMNDPDVTRYLECRFRSYTEEDLRGFVRAMVDSGNNFLFGIYDGEKHVGNIKIGNVDWKHRYGDLGLVIGLKEYWGRGVATKAIDYCCSYAKCELGLRKLFAGIYDGNVGSLKAFLKCGFSKVGVLKEHRICGGTYVDELIVERLL